MTTFQIHFKLLCMLIQIPLRCIPHEPCYLCGFGQWPGAGNRQQALPEPMMFQVTVGLNMSHASMNQLRYWHIVNWNLGGREFRYRPFFMQVYIVDIRLREKSMSAELIAWHLKSNTTLSLLFVVRHTICHSSVFCCPYRMIILFA